MCVAIRVGDLHGAKGTSKGWVEYQTHNALMLVPRYDMVLEPTDWRIYIDRTHRRRSITESVAPGRGVITTVYGAVMGGSSRGLDTWLLSIVSAATLRIEIRFSVSGKRFT